MALTKKSIDADRDLLAQLVPPGAAMRTYDAPVQKSFWWGCAEGLKRLRDFIVDVAAEGNPLTAVQTIDFWMGAYSLPLKYLPPPADIAAKRAQLKTRIPRGMSHNPATFEALALALGYTITVTAAESAYYGIAVCGDLLLGVAESYTWIVTTSEVPASAGALAIEGLVNELHHHHMTIVYNHLG